ncbi:MAG: hypothetical protein ACOX4U_07395 [Anaerovoracaceae bacterium]
MNQLRQWRTLIGIALILIAFLGFGIWETAGRSHFLMDEILVAKEEIPEGVVLTKEMVDIIKIDSNNKAEGAVDRGGMEKVIGKTTNNKIFKKQQLIYQFFTEKEFNIDKGLSFFKIPQEWIAMRSSSLRRGDRVELYLENSLKYLGQFQVAFVKDNNENEVTDMDGAKKKAAIDRENSTSMISHIEIISTIEQYNAIATACMQNGEGGFDRIIIVQKGDKLT